MKRIAFVVVFGFNLGAAVLYADSGQDAEMAAQKLGGGSVAPTGSADKIAFTGSFTYTYPIEIPPGIAGIQPNLSFSYNSGGGNGWVGAGWDLSLGTIQRSTKNGVPTYSDSDVFTFVGGGAAVELVSADGGAVNYRPRIEGAFQRYVRENGGWTVYDKSGMKLYFGLTGYGRSGPSSSQTYLWALEKVVDRNGNWYTVTYSRDFDQLYPDTILYTGNDVTGKVHRRVHFTLAARPDWIFTYRPGFRIDTGLRLVSIETSINANGAAAGPWTPVRTYTLGYGVRAMGARSELTTIQVSGIDGTSTITLPPHQFGYENALSGSSFWSAQSANSGYQLPNFITYNPRDNGMRFAELNGDGKIDLVRFYSLNNAPQVDTWLNTGSGFSTTSGWHLPVPVTVEGNGTWWDGGVRLVDLNGDGLTDVLRGLNYHENTPTMEAWINTGTDFVSSPTWKVPNANYCFTVTGVTNGVEWSRDNGVSLVDVNGDGLPDLVQSVVIDAVGEAHSVRLNTGHGWAAGDSPNWNIPPFTTLIAHDGRTCVPNGVEFVDLNGDGLIDIVQNIRELSTLADSNHRWLNTGSGWVETPGWDNFDYLMYRDSTKPFDNGVRFADMNGDGLPDLVESLWQTTPTAIDRRVVRLNTGVAWGPPINWNFPEVFAQNDLNARNGLNTGTALIDINGDGVPDMVRAFAQPGAQVNSLSFGLMNPELINHVTSPAGGSVDATYGVASREGTHQIPFPVTYLKSLTVGDGRGGSIGQTFSYQGGLFDPSEREFLGFARVDATDAAGVTTLSYFNQVTSDAGGRMGGNPLKGRMYRQDVMNGTSLMKRTDTEWEAPILAPAARFARVKSVADTLYDGPGPQSSKMHYLYDDAASPRLGNVLQTVDEGDPAVSGDEQTADVEYSAPAAGATTTGFPKRRRLLGPSGETLSETQFLYDGLTYGTVSRGNLTTLRRWLDKPAPGKWIETYAVYNASGQVTRAVDGRGAAESMTYDAFGFLGSQTNRKNQTSQSAIDPRTGGVSTETDPNGLVTTNSYDALGRLLKTFGPDDSAAFPTVSYSYHDELLGSPSLERVDTEVREKSGQSGTLLRMENFDGLGRSYRTTTENVGDSVTTEAQFDGRGLSSAVSVPRFAATGGNPLWVSTTYDALGRPLRVTQPDATFTQMTYFGRHTDLRDALGRIHGSDVDAEGRVVRRTEPSVTAATQYAYDVAGRLTTVTNAGGQGTALTYDSLGRKLTTLDPNAGLWTYAYDDNGNLTAQTDPRGVKLSFAYDALDRLTSRTLSADPGAVTGSPVGTTVASFAYDETAGRPYSIGQLTSAGDPAGTIAFYHDRMGRVNREVHTIDGTNYEMRTVFDAASRPTTVTYPSDGRLSFAYNAGGLPDTIVNESSATLAQYAGYDAMDRATQITLGGGKTRTTLTFDILRGVLTRAKTDSYATGSPVSFRDISYVYDIGRNITGLTDNLAGGRSQTFAYDALDRVTSATGSYGAETYAYDDLGNFLSKGGRSYAYQDPHHPGAVTQVGSSGFPATDASTVLAWGLDPSEAIYTIGGTAKNTGGTAAGNIPVVLSGPANIALLSSTGTPVGKFEFRNVAGGVNYAVALASAGLTSLPSSLPFNPLAANSSGNILTLISSTQTTTGSYEDQFTQASPVNPTSHTMDVGPGWTGPDASNGHLKVGAVTSKLTCTINGAAGMFMNGTPPTSDYSVAAFGRAGSGATTYSRIYLYGRWDTATNTGYYVVVKGALDSGNNNYYVTYSLNGEDQYDLFGGSTTINATTDDTWELRMVGHQISLLKDGVVLASVNDAAVSAPGKAGLGLDHPQPEIDWCTAVWNTTSQPVTSSGTYDDEFTQASAVNPAAHAMDAGPGWTGNDASNGRLKVGAVANKLTCTLDGGAGIFVNGTPPTADYSVIAHGRAGSGATTHSRIYLYGRWDTATNTGYYVVVKGALDSGNNNYYVTYSLNGEDQYDLFGGSTTLNTTTDYAWELKMIGNQISLLKDGVVLASVHDSAVSASGKAGLGLDHPQPQADSFQMVWSSTTSTTTPVSGYTVVGPTFVAGKVGQALSFNGTSDAFIFPNSAGLASGNFTLMAQVNVAALPSGYGTVLSKSTSSALGQITAGTRLLIDASGKARFEIGRSTGALSILSANPLALNQWNFLAATYDGAAMKLYVNGVLSASASCTGALPNGFALSAGASLTDQRNLAGGTFFAGVLDEPRVHNRAWTAAEIAAVQNQFGASSLSSYAYDAAGNCIAKTTQNGAWAYFYNADGRLRRVDKDGVTAATFVYDATGARVKKITPAGTTLSIGDVYEQRPDGSRIDHIAGIGDVVRQGSAVATFYSHGDHLGSVQQITNASGAVVQTADYKPFGERFQTTGASSNRRWYTGQEEDTETGLDYYKARYYDPDLGRFASADTVVASEAAPQTMNRYAYVDNGPTGRTDPTGHNWLSANIDGFNKNFIANGLVLQTLDKAAGTAVLASRPDGQAILIGQAATAASFGVSAAAGWGALSGAAVSYISAMENGRDPRSAVFWGAAEGTATSETFDGADTHMNLAASVILKGAASGEIARAHGGDFWQAFAMQAMATLANGVYTKFVGYSADPSPGAALDRDAPLGKYTYSADLMGRGPNGADVFGGNNPLKPGASRLDRWTHQGAPLMRTFSAVPGANATAQLHDVFRNLYQSSNALSMFPAAAVAYQAIFSNALAPVITMENR